MQNHTELTAAQKKKLLIAQGAAYRLGLIESKNTVSANLHADALAKHAFSRLAATASTALGHGMSIRSFAEGNFQTILPLLLSGFSLLAKRRRLIKPLLIGAVVSAAAGIAASLVRRARPKATAADEI
jgi:hypothetical protein